MPYLEKIHRRLKPRGLPEVGQQVQLPPNYPASRVGGFGEQPVRVNRDADTPYRLPRLYGSETSLRAESVTSSQQRCDYLSPTPGLQQTSQDFMRMSGSPLKVPIKASFDYPRLKHAIIAPKQAVQFTRSGRPRVDSEIRHYPALQTPDYIARPQTSLSNTGSIHWALGTNTNINFDRMGSSRYTGPYSRIFTKTCTAPNNWLRMKLGVHRSQTVVYTS